jgi:hypothetical protein
MGKSSALDMHSGYGRQPEWLWLTSRRNGKNSRFVFVRASFTRPATVQFTLSVSQRLLPQERRPGARLSPSQSAQSINSIYFMLDFQLREAYSSSL